MINKWKDIEEGRFSIVDYESHPIYFVIVENRPYYIVSDLRTVPLVNGLQ